jgi:hypothetical protein
MSGEFPEPKTYSNLPKTADQKDLEAKIEREQLSNYIDDGKSGDDEGKDPAGRRGTIF